MRMLSLFAGIGGIDLAAHWAGIETVAFCEIEPFCQKVLQKHWPEVPIFDDVRTINKQQLIEKGVIGDERAIDIICGGYPCQPFSTAGERKGKDDDRHLWPEVSRLLQEIRPTWFLGENVAGHVTLGLDDVLSDLEGIGYAAEPFVIPACAVNARHRRDRVFIVAHSMRSVLSSEQESQHQTVGRRQDSLAHGEKQLLARLEDVADSASKGLQEWRQSGISQGKTKSGTGMELEPERCSEDVANANGSGCEEQHVTSKPKGQGFYTGGTASGWEQWAIEPGVGRVANGIPKRVDRLKSLGNAVVPQQVFPILWAIKKIHDGAL
ncbi:DNA cytosine methyltransferase [Brevibacillus porteri]|uniref:Cytosine-specific methyltransferase n=1 Tax=Brevibacillus porteri TaxID=2126350 RepID=A0ABX5FSG5_9BACL|nr:DNA (cytosine-5-)-methyltransferase [Brevibacillus porteri]MED1801816.1 DNA (cytosine-5-)-methyltransferase [Brevibacillus porteri]MED2134947.1 DNA (cytosine-5-)-methyltransferase [Brevibacillus porteri]MED2745469.1 DNA (cytosine-5-)-methyltransferase [Brevibacillus porteri]MED2815785.1 DNA (cytosine-5-)-methyltransferase [Brevibacillus porteri]MED2897623.1 DNA (cytosine-5-)-methyltransferase [Brevibacillus porteri]